MTILFDKAFRKKQGFRKKGMTGQTHRDLELIKGGLLVQN